MSLETSCKEAWTLDDGTILEVRHISPRDSEIEQAFVRGLSDWSRYQRFHGTIKELSKAQLQALTHPDPRYETALIVVHRSEHGEEEIAVARYMIDADGKSCEFAIVVADAWQHRGVGTRLLNALINHAKAEEVERLYDPVLKSNTAMRSFAQRLGFKESASADDPSLIVLSRTL